MPITTIINLDYLIDGLRLHIGDTDATTYRYLDEWLRTALVMAVKSLQRWWSYKYLIDVTNNVYRNTNFTDFTLEESLGIIQQADEKPIILMASMVLKEGELEKNAWGSWRDNEIAYSNLEGSRSKDSGIEKDWRELTSILKPPSKKLAKGYRQSILEFPES